MHAYTVKTPSHFLPRTAYSKDNKGKRIDFFVVVVVASFPNASAAGASVKANARFGLVSDLLLGAAILVVSVEREQLVVV